MRLHHLLAWTVVGLAPVGACGQETVQLGSSQGVDAAVDSAVSDAAAACMPGQPATCAPNGATCTTASECCSSRCESGYCLPSGACTAPGSTCQTRSTCCSGRCEPNGGNRECLPYCATDGSPCPNGPLDCCSLACSGGVCGGMICKVLGTTCASDEECCSSSCNNGSCSLDSSTTCLPSGEGCAGADGGVACCSGVCNTTSSRCDPGPGACREPGVPCTVDGDCCRGQCMPGPTGVSVCSAACLGDGADCNSAGDCCTRMCTGVPSKCGGITCRD